MIKKFILNLSRPQSANEDDRRRESILNILTLSSIGLMLVANLIEIYSFLTGPYQPENSLSLGGLLLILGIFIGIYFWSRTGHFKLAAQAFVGVYFLLTSLLAYLWGIDLPVVPLFYGLIIIMTGILINARRAFLTTAATGLVLFLIGYLQINNHISVNAYWRQDFADLSDVFLFIIILTIIAVISWLFNRDLEKSLHRAQTSEAALKQERDLLEIKVEERTAEIKRMQIEKMNQLYRLAEFGRLASGIFHDLVNPLTALSLNLTQAKKTEALKLSQPYIYLQQALAASQKIEELVLALKKQLRTKAEKTNFSVNEEIEQIRKILNYKLIKNNLAINFRITQDYRLYGSSLKFSQIILNLLSNAIDAYYTINSNARRPITIETREKNNYFYLIVKDYGTGFTAANLPKIFEPFFTTKNDGQDGLGLGLSTTKNITEKDFGGRITAHRRQPRGAKFIVRLPLKNDHRTINDSLL